MRLVNCIVRSNSFYLQIILICCFSFKFSLAQSPTARNYTTNDGLPSAVIYSMIQDKNGYMWFGSENGVCRFDGKTFKTFTTKDGLTDNAVLALFEDSKGRIWFFTLNGKLCFYFNGKIYNKTNEIFLKQLPDFSVTYGFVEDDFGNIYLRNIRHLLVFNEKSFKLLDVPMDSSLRIWKINNQVSCFMDRWILFKSDSSIFFYGKEGLIEYKDRRIKLIIPRDKLPKDINPHLQIKIGNQFWLGSFHPGVIRIENIFSDTPEFSKLLQGVQVNLAYLDREGNLWISSSNQGVFVYKDIANNAAHFRKENGLQVENIHVLHTDKSGNVWAGSVDNTLYVIHHGKCKKIQLETDKGTASSSVYDIVETDNGRLYIATSFNIYEINTSNFRFDKINKSLKPTNFKYLHPNYKSLALTSNNDLLALSAYSLIRLNETQSGWKQVIESNDKNLRDRNFSVSVSTNGGIWVSSSRGLNLVKNNEMISLAYVSPWLKEPISKIIEAPDGNLIMSTRSSGILVYDKLSKVTRFSEKDGLASDICNKIHLYDDKLWVATSSGVSQLFYNNGRITLGRNYTIEDGLLANEVNDVVKLGDKLYAATAEGITMFNESSRRLSSPPPIYFNDAYYGDRNLLQTSNLSLEFSDVNLKFGFTAITYQYPQKLVYAYRMAGADENWRNTNNASVEYPALPPGEYTFEVKAKKINSDWSETKRIHFIINAPFWMQNWFYVAIYCLVFSMISGIVYVLVRRKRKIRFEKMGSRNRMIQLEQQALSALMNPHFIFNALNSIQHYLQQNDQLTANKYLSLFARLTRRNMEAVMQNKVSLEDELERLELYLQFEKLRFGDKLQYRILLPESFSADEYFLPPMVLQPFVENAIWHGLMPKPQGGEIFIRISDVKEDLYTVEIIDNGVGIENSKAKKTAKEHNSKGMQLTKERLNLWANQLNTSFKLQVSQRADKEGGTIVLLTLPTG